MARRRGVSVRLKLTLSYAGFLLVAGALLLLVVRVFLLRYVPDVPYGGQSLRFLGGPDRSDLEEAFTPRAMQAMACLLVFGLVGGWLLAGWMLSPLSRITDATRQAASGSLAHRIRLPGRNDELRELADAFDAMLERLEAHVAEQQRFAANASHELRTPLAITQMLLDVARKDGNQASGELLDRLHAVNARAIELTEAMLLLSRADQRTFTRSAVDLSPLAEERGVTMETTGDVAPTSGSHTLLLQLTTNLVHNAIVHNVPEGAVWVRTSVGSEGAALTVENTGGQLSPHVVATLAEPFLRGTERVRTEHHVGVGLGLAIVKRIAEAHDGSLGLSARAGGGLRATVLLPAATA